MKDIYELLNEIDIDENKFEEMEVNELEKAKVKKALKQSLNLKKKNKGWLRNIAVAVVIAGLSTVMFGLTFPAYAGNIPVIGDIFRFLDFGRTGLYDEYKEYSSELNMTEDSNGIKITINDAVFDGKTVSVTYSILSEQELGENPIIHGFPDIKGSNGKSGSSIVSRIGENHYVGLFKATDLSRTNEKAVKVDWNIESIRLPDKQEEIKGNWNFAFSLNATDSKVLMLEQSAEQNGVRVNIGNVSITPMSFIVHYNQEVSEEVINKWHEVNADIEIKDNLGNHYNGEDNGGSGDGYNNSWSKTFGKLDPKATRLIITPHITLREHTPENFGGVELTEDGPREIPIETKLGKGKEEFVLEDIIIELKK